MKKGTLKDTFSINEYKVSALILCLLTCMAFGGYNYIVHGDVTDNLTNIILALITAVAGVNIADRFTANKNTPEDVTQEYSEYNNF
ncbi:MAG: hypothetical protein ACRDDX_10610 [Cellulosilyticaceae bacterium]